MAAEIVFETQPYHVFERDCLAVNAVVGERRIACLITGELLMSRFEAQDLSEGALRDAYERHKGTIQTILRQYIEYGWVDERDRVILTTRYTRLSVKFPKDRVEDAKATQWVEMAHRILIELMGPEAGNVQVEWTRTGRDDPANAGLALRVQDPRRDVDVSAIFDASQFEDETRLGIMMGRVWGSVLRARSRDMSLKVG